MTLLCLSLLLGVISVYSTAPAFPWFFSSLFWVDVFVLLCIFFLGCVLIALFLWVDCSVSLGLFGFLGFIFLPPVAVFFFSVSPPIFSLLCSGFSSPFYRETCPSTSPAFAGLLFKLRTGSWARDVVHDLLQISC